MRRIPVMVLNDRTAEQVGLYASKSPLILRLSIVGAPLAVRTQAGAVVFAFGFARRIRIFCVTHG
jgi:hypothetical protein